MKLYEIDEEIMNLLDEETGEILDKEAFEKLNGEKNRKIEHLCLAIKNYDSDINELKEEKKSFDERIKLKENEKKRAISFLESILQGAPFETAKVKVSYTKSTQTQVDDGFIEWAEKYYDSLLNFKSPEPNKTEIKKAIKDGKVLPYVKLVDCHNIKIK